MTLEQKILAALKPHANKSRAAHDVGYMKSRYAILGCSMPVIRNVAKKFGDISDAELDQLWKTSDSFDVLYVALIIQGSKPIRMKDWPRLKRWSQKIDNWAHSDTLSQMIAHMLEQHSNIIYPHLQAWNHSKKSWQRRLSLTSLLYYSSGRTKCLPPEKILPLVKARLNDSDLYVQKAVGWTLRECGNCYPEKTRAFIKHHVRDLSSIAFTSATEKWLIKEKRVLKHARRLRM